LANCQTADTVKHWKTDGQLGIFVNQATFSDNWKGGGSNSIALGGVAQFSAKYDRSGFSFAHDTQLNFGVVQNQGQGQRKTNDLIFIDNKLGYKFAGKWDFFASSTIITQFAQGFNYDKDATGADRTTYISNFFSPGYLTEALGTEYRPTSYVNFRLGLAGLRHTIVTDTNLYKTVASNYGVSKGDYVRTQVILQLLGTFDKEIAKNLNLKARYLGMMDYGKLSKPAEGLIHRLDVSVTAKVNKFINVNLGAIFLYDYDQDKKVQYSQSLALGFLFKF
jgi:hypothetical protein